MQGMVCIQESISQEINNLVNSFKIRFFKVREQKWETS